MGLFTVYCSLLWILLHIDGSISAQPPGSQVVGPSDYLISLFLEFAESISFSNAINIDTVIISIDIVIIIMLLKYYNNKNSEMI